MTSDVFFVTNRDFKNGGFGKNFHKDGPDHYRVGSAEVVKNGTDYKLESFEVFQERANRSGNDEDSKLGSSEMFKQLKALMKQKRDVIVHIHGYSTNFKTALERAGELADKYVVEGKDGVLRNPVVVSFSWPANGRNTPWKAYMSDRKDAKKSGPALGKLFLRLCQFLVNETLVLRRSGGLDEEAQQCHGRIHLVAHSMGNWALRHGLLDVIEERGADRLPAIFDNIFLMAADEDHDALENIDKLALLPELCNAVHVYHSKDDLALVISDTTKLNPNRLGSNGPRDMTLVDDKVFAIDCRYVDETEITHGVHQYYRLRTEVVEDVKAVLAGTLPGDIPNRVTTDHLRKFVIEKPVD